MNKITITGNNNFVYQGSNENVSLRGFEFVKGWEDKTILPARQTQNSSGYDFYLPCDIIIEPMESIVIESGIKAYMPSNEELLLSMRSKWAIKNKLILLGGKIDSDYYNNSDNEGHIFISIMNLGKETFKLAKGERICQGTFYVYQTTNDTVIATRKGGIGSTNK
jgi:dUTP pyrophosphatase